MACQACEERGKNWRGDDPTCAFRLALPWSEFNWRCATDGMIRDLVDDPNNLPHGVAYQYCDEQKYATIDVSEIDFEAGRFLTLWVSWYKSRGRTDSMWLLPESGQPTRPTEADLREIAKAYASRKLSTESAR